MNADRGNQRNITNNSGDLESVVEPFPQLTPVTEEPSPTGKYAIVIATIILVAS